MKARFLDRFEVILLDLGHTFMFDCDKFSEQEDFWATYVRLGGGRLGFEQIREVLLNLYSFVCQCYSDPVLFERFPNMKEMMARCAAVKEFARNEGKLIEEVFAAHEIGTVTPEYADVLSMLRRTHRLGLVSNTWSDSKWYLDEFERAGIRGLFETIIFSSDHGCIKPSPRLFENAISVFNVDRAKIVFVGDSYKRDIGGAKGVGISAVWIQNDRHPIPPEGPRPDLVIRDLKELLRV